MTISGFKPSGSGSTRQLGSPADDLVDHRLQFRLVREAIDVQHALGFGVVGLEFGKTERPGETLEVGIGLELVGGEAQQRRAVPFRLAAEIVMFAGRDEGLAMAVLPFGLVGEAALLEYDFRRQGRSRRAAAGRPSRSSAPARPL